MCAHLLSGGKRHSAKGKLVAGQKWEKTNTITGLRAFWGFANYYSGYVRDYAAIVSPMMELLKAGRLEGKKGSSTKVKWTTEADLAFVGTKEALIRELSLQKVKSNLPFVLRATSKVSALASEGE